MNNALHTVLVLDNLFPNFGKDYPLILKNKAEELVMQSTTKIPGLKAEETARPYLCAYLAFEALENQISEYMDGRLPEVTKIPLPAKRTKILLPLFRNKLFGYSDSTINGVRSKRSPRKQTQPNLSPKKNNLEGVVTVSPSKPSNLNFPPLLPTPAKKLDSESSNEEDDEDDEASAKPIKKRSRISGIKTSSRAKDPARDQIITLCESLQVKKPVCLAILRGYKLYSNLVKDKWGLLCGIIVVIISKGQPQLIERGTQAFYGRLKHLVSISDDRLEEWIRWAASIINDQSWIKKVTDPSSKTSVVQKEYRKYSSGIGNMVSIYFGIS